jgi:hypothetical protein
MMKSQEFLRDLDNHLDEQNRRSMELALTIMAEGECRLMGRPVRVRAEWPEGMPVGFGGDAVAMRRWAEAELARMREA